MRVGRLVGTLVAALVGGSVLAGGAATGVVPVAVASVVGTLLAAALAYAVGDRRFPVGVAAAVYLSAGGAALSGAIADRPPWGLAVTAVGAALLAGYLVRLRTGNARRVATLPIDPGPLRRFEATVAGAVLTLQSVVERVAGLRAGRVRAGTILVVGLWAGVVAAGAGLATTLPAQTAAVAEVGLLVALVWPFYVGTDWTAIDAPEPEAGGSTADRIAAVRAAFLVAPERVADERAEPAPTVRDDERPAASQEERPAGTDGPRTTDDPTTAEEATGTDDPDEEFPSPGETADAPSSPDGGSSDATAAGSFTRGSTTSDGGGPVPELDPNDRRGRRRGRRRRKRDEDVPEFRSVEEIGPTTAGSGSSSDADAGESSDEDVPELDVTPEPADEPEGDGGIADRVSRILEQNEGWHDDQRWETDREENGESTDADDDEGGQAGEGDEDEDDAPFEWGNVEEEDA